MPTYTLRRALGGLSILLLFAVHTHAVNMITNYPSWDGSTHAGNFGPPPGTPTFGQTFRADVAQSVDGMSAPILESFRFMVQNLTPGTGSNGQITMNAYLYQWNGTSIVGSSLALPWVFSVNSGSGYQNVGVSFGPVTLTPGLDYIVFWTTLGNDAYNTNHQAANFGALTNDTVAHSSFFYNDGTTFSDLFAPWSASTSLAELAFQAQFRTVALPDTGSALVLLLLGSLIVFALKLRLAT